MDVTHIGFIVLGVAMLASAVLYKLVLRVLFGMVIIDQSSIGIVNKKWVLFGKNKVVPVGSIIALKGEAGIQADTLAPGAHWGYFPWQYTVTSVSLVNIPQGQIGILQALDGKSITSVIANTVDCNNFQNARMFLENGGERGAQSGYLAPGTYRINTSLFTVQKISCVDIPDDSIGVVTTKAGKELPPGAIAGPIIPEHDSFQNPDAFITNGGYKGVQEQVLLPGRYFLNPQFVAVTLEPLTQVPIAHVGVVISYIGEDGLDTSGADFKHGTLVEQGKKGVWATPLDPGKYPINPRTHKVELVQTSNLVLNWANTKSEAHNLDKNLCTIRVRSVDGFDFNIDVSQIIHIPALAAPKVIARFGTMSELITQVLGPTIGNYFRNAAQKSEALSFLNNRSQRQDEAKKTIGEALTTYDVNAIDTLIGDVTMPESLTKILTERKLAEQEQETYRMQQTAEEARKNLEQARATAATQPKVVEAERQVQIAEFNANAEVKKAEGEAQAKRIQAEADATVRRTMGEADAAAIQNVGEAEANVARLKVEAMQSDSYALVQIVEALASHNVKVVPDIMVGGSSGSGGGLLDVLLAKLITQPAESSEIIDQQNATQRELERLTKLTKAITK